MLAEHGLSTKFQCQTHKRSSSLLHLMMGSAKTTLQAKDEWIGFIKHLLCRLNVSTKTHSATQKPTTKMSAKVQNRAHLRAETHIYLTPNIMKTVGENERTQMSGKTSNTFGAGNDFHERSPRHAVIPPGKTRKETTHDKAMRMRQENRNSTVIFSSGGNNQRTVRSFEGQQGLRVESGRSVRGGISDIADHPLLEEFLLWIRV